MLSCAKVSAKTPTITIVGPGRLGTALALALHQNGFTVSEIIGRDEPASRSRTRSLARRVGARATTVAGARLDCDILWICVQDAAIQSCARTLSQKQADWKHKIIFHSSGALTSDELEVLKQRGAATASLHPMMTFVSGAHPSLAGVTFAGEGDSRALRTAKRIVSRVGGTFVAIEKRAKPMYHAWGAFGSPLLVSLLALAEEVAAVAGLPAKQARKTIAPMLRRTVENYVEHGPVAAFSGPLVRGDTNTVRKHLDVLRSLDGAAEVYRALADAALRLLPVTRREELESLLKEAQASKTARSKSKRVREPLSRGR